MLHYPPWYGSDRAIASLEMFAREVMPKVAGRAGVGRRAGAEAHAASL
jgi:hypothetical protein